MSIVLQPGVKIPEFSLPAANLKRPYSSRELAGKKSILIFFPAGFEESQLEQLAKFGTQPRLAEAELQLVAISDAEEAALQELAAQTGIEFPLLSDSCPAGATARAYRVWSERQQILPTVFVADETGLIHRVYEAGQYPNLPNPAMVARAVKKLAAVPRPAPVTEQDWQLGPAEAPVTVIEYADYECKPCGEAYRLLKQLLPRYEGQVRWVHRHLPLRHSHPLAQQAAEAAEAAGAQQKFWEMHDRLFAARGALERENLIAYASEIGLNVARFTADLADRRFKEAVNEDFKQAVRHQIKLPPVLFINNLPVDGPRTEAAIRDRIETLLACLTSKEETGANDQ